MMNRRVFSVAGFGAIGLAWTAAEAQTMRTPGKIGYIHPVTTSPGEVTRAILGRAWQRLGYVDSVSVLARSAGADWQKVPDIVEELKAQGCGVLIVVGAEAVRAAARTTTTIPIVAIDLESDPVATGLVASYARPGGNVTGLFLDLPALAGKWIELLREAAPSLERIALLWDPDSGRSQLDVAVAAARGIGIEAVVVEAPAIEDFETALKGLGSGRRTGIVQLSAPGASTNAWRFSAAAVRHGLPHISFLTANARAGVLMSYGPDQEAYFPRAVEIANKILRGERAGDIPIERPSRFELAVNLLTAKAIGLTIPPSILVRADEVIE